MNIFVIRLAQIHDSESFDAQIRYFPPCDVYFIYRQYNIHCRVNSSAIHINCTFLKNNSVVIGMYYITLFTISK